MNNQDCSTSQTVTEYLLDITEAETGYRPDADQIDIGFYHRMVEALNECDESDVDDDGNPVYWRATLEWAYARAGEEV